MAGLDVDRTWIIRAFLTAALAVAVVVIGAIRRPAAGSVARQIDR